MIQGSCPRQEGQGNRSMKGEYLELGGEGEAGQGLPGREMGLERSSGWRCPRGAWPRGRWCCPGGGGAGNGAQGKVPRHGDSLGMVGRSCPGELEQGPGRGCGIRAGSDRSLRDVARRPGHTALPVRSCSSLPAPGESGLPRGDPATLPAHPGGPCSSQGSSRAHVLALRKNSPRPHHPRHRSSRAGLGRAVSASAPSLSPGSAHLDQHTRVSTPGLTHLAQHTWIGTPGSAHLVQHTWPSTPGPAHLCSGTFAPFPPACSALGFLPCLALLQNPLRISGPAQGL